MLFLAPDDSSVLIFVAFVLDTLDWEWRDLLDTDYGDLVLLEVVASLEDVVVDLSRAEDNLLNLLRADEVGCGVWDDHSESLFFAEFFDIGDGLSNEKMGLTSLSLSSLFGDMTIKGFL